MNFREGSLQRMKKRVKSTRWKLADSMFLSLFITGTVIEFSQVGSGLIDGLIISRYLGAQEMAAEGIVHPIYSIMGIISGLLAVGMQVRCTQLIGRGNKKDVSRFFSTTVFIGSLVSVLFAAAIVVFAKPFAALLGARGNAAELLSSASKYLIGIGVGIPPLIMTAVLAPAVQLDSGRKTIQRGALIEAVSDIALDLLAVKLGLGILGVGLATAVASYLNLLYQCTHFLKKDRMLHLVKPDIPAREFMSMLSDGGERALKRLMNTLRPVVLNMIIIAYGGAIAMSALSVRNSISNFVEIFGAGIASAVSLLTGMYFGEVNGEAIEEVDACEKRLVLICCGSVCALMLLFAPLIARFYVRDNKELFRLVTFALQMLALQNPLQALIANRIKYLQAIRRRRNMNLLIFAAQFVFVLLSALVLGKLFGVYGILACFTVSDGISMLAVYIFYAVQNRTHRITRHELLALPPEFDLFPGDVISLDIRDEQDVVFTSEQIQLFCKGHKYDPKVGYYAALTFEELASNIIEYGFPQNKKKNPIIDLRVVALEDALIMRIRDDCPHFDITKRIAEINGDDSDPTGNLGIRITSKTAKDISYTHAFETNNIIITYSQPKAKEAVCE